MIGSRQLEQKKENGSERRQGGVAVGSVNKTMRGITEVAELFAKAFSLNERIVWI